MKQGPVRKTETTLGISNSGMLIQGIGSKGIGRGGRAKGRRWDWRTTRVSETQRSEDAGALELSPQASAGCGETLLPLVPDPRTRHYLEQSWNC